MKIVYIAHPISGDVKGNLEKIKDIVAEIYATTDDITPFVPYFLDCLVLDDNVPEERLRGMKNNKAYFVKGAIDELWLYGDRISKGMEQEIALAEVLGIPVVDKTFKAYEAAKNN